MQNYRGMRCMEQWYPSNAYFRKPKWNPPKIQAYADRHGLIISLMSDEGNYYEVDFRRPPGEVNTIEFKERKIGSTISMTFTLGVFCP
jgi:hypothetical protein